MLLETTLGNSPTLGLLVDTVGKRSLESVKVLVCLAAVRRDVSKSELSRRTLYLLCRSPSGGNLTLESFLPLSALTNRSCDFIVNSPGT